MNVPDYLTYYFRDNQKPFEVLTDLDDNVAKALLRNDTLWRGDGTYLTHRKNHEKVIRDLFIQKGGRPKRDYPIYAILGESPIGPHDLENEYIYKINIPLHEFTRNDISFTYPDSLYEVPLDDLGRLYLQRNDVPIVYTIDELSNVIEKYHVYEYNNHYMEAQIWNDEPVEQFADKSYWKKCIRR